MVNGENFHGIKVTLIPLAQKLMTAIISSDVACS